MFVSTKYGEIMISVNDEFMSGGHSWKILYLNAGTARDKVLCEMEETGDGALFTPEDVATWCVESHERIDQLDEIYQRLK